MQNENQEAVKTTLLEWVIKTGGLGVALAVMVWFHQDFTKMHRNTVEQHRQERREWKNDMKELSGEWIDAVAELKDAIHPK